MTIVSFTSEEAFLASEAVYSIGILSKDFLSVLEFSGKEMVHEKFYLCDEIIASEYEHLPMVYKYQSMEIVEEMLKRLATERDKQLVAPSRKGKDTVYRDLFTDLTRTAITVCFVLSTGLSGEWQGLIFRHGGT